METKTPQRLTSKEFAVICRMISELKEEVLNVKNGVHAKIDIVTKSIKDAFEGFGILDPDEDTWTEQQVCEHYHVTRRTMYNYRKAGLITGYKTGGGRNCKINYRKADVMELFASENA